MANQIGFGQSYDAYLDDLQKVFSAIHYATKKNGSLWIVIDTFRQNQEVLPLPFDLVARLKTIGWVLRDVIIWKKQRTLPWTHKGTTRKIFEYVLVLSKGKQPFRYFPNMHRDTSDLKRWWVRYPERYNPRGKALEEIWSYDIPTQGSWGSKYIRHFCPLPSELVSRIINLTTKKGDVVLDPFSGSGTVPLQAQSLNRRYVGFELNKEYIQMYKKHQSNLRHSKDTAASLNLSSRAFEKLVISLRILKFGRLLYRLALKQEKSTKLRHILVRPLKKKPVTPHKICSAEYLLIADKPISANVEKRIRDITNKPPFSKFGIEANIRIHKAKSVPASYRSKKVYLYSSTDSHRFSDHVSIAEALKGKSPIVSLIRAQVEEPDE